MRPESHGLPGLVSACILLSLLASLVPSPAAPTKRWNARFYQATPLLMGKLQTSIAMSHKLVITAGTRPRGEDLAIHHKFDTLVRLRGGGGARRGRRQLDWQSPKGGRRGFGDDSSSSEWEPDDSDEPPARTRRRRKTSSNQQESDDYTSSDDENDREESPPPQRVAHSKKIAPKAQHAANQKARPTTSGGARNSAGTSMCAGRPPKREAAKQAEKLCSIGAIMDANLERALQGLDPLSFDEDEDAPPFQQYMQQQYIPPPAPPRKAAAPKPAPKPKPAGVPRIRKQAAAQVMPMPTSSRPQVAQPQVKMPGQGRSAAMSMWEDMPVAATGWDMGEDGVQGGADEDAWNIQGDMEDVEGGMGLGGGVAEGWGDIGGNEMAPPRPRHDLLASALGHNNGADQRQQQQQQQQREVQRQLQQQQQQQEREMQRQLQQQQQQQQQQEREMQRLLQQQQQEQIQLQQRQEIMQDDHFEYVEQDAGEHEQLVEHPKQRIQEQQHALAPQLQQHEANAKELELVKQALENEPVQHEVREQQQQQLQQDGAAQQAASVGLAPPQLSFLLEANDEGSSHSTLSEQASSSAPPCSADPSHPSTSHSHPQAARVLSTSLSGSGTLSTHAESDGDLQMMTAGEEQHMEALVELRPETVMDRLEEALASVQRVSGAMVMNQRAYVAPGTPRGECTPSSVHAAEIDRAIGDALQLAREQLDEVKGLPASVRAKINGAGLNGLERGIASLGKRAEVLGDLLKSRHRREELLAATAYPTKLKVVHPNDVWEDAARREALAAKRALILDGSWRAVARTASGVPLTGEGEGNSGTKCVYFGGYCGVNEATLRDMVERRCGRTETFEWHSAWSFARWSNEDAAARALAMEWKEAARGSSLVVLPAPEGRIVRGGLLLEMGVEAAA